MSTPAATKHGLLVLQIRSVIEFAVQAEIRINYLPLAKSLKLFSGSKQIGAALGSIMEEDHTAGRPLTCALVVSSTTGMPGRGFFEKARSLGYQFTDETIFWQDQCQALAL
jgi:hypothetical protein